MRRGGYRGSEDTSGLLGCAIIAPIYLLGIAWIIENLAFRGEDLLALAVFVLWTFAAFAVVLVVQHATSLRRGGRA
jgi:hypothetical protein